MKNIFLSVLFLLSVSYSYSQNYNTYSTNQYGQNTKSGEIRQNSYGSGYSTYSTNQYGQNTKSGEIKQNSYGSGYSTYSTNQIWSEHKVRRNKTKLLWIRLQHIFY